jgi:hypothetical protein
MAAMLAFKVGATLNQDHESENYAFFVTVAPHPSVYSSNMVAARNLHLAFGVTEIYSEL